jgi:hypothetical protein
MNQVVQLLEKEEIKNLTFKNANISISSDLINKLKSAEKLGNSYKGKVAIYFETTDGIKKTETTIWITTDDYIQLKAGITIPTKSIVDVRF